MNNLNDSISPMTQQLRGSWLFETARSLQDDFIAKYNEGQKQHGGDLGEVPTAELMGEAKSEVLDQMAYLAELDRRLAEYNRLVVDLVKIAHAFKQNRVLLDEHQTCFLKMTVMLGMEDFRYDSVKDIEEQQYKPRCDVCSGEHKSGDCLK